MLKTDTAPAGEQPQAASSVPTGGEQPQEAPTPADFTSAIDGMNNADDIGGILFHGKVPEPTEPTPPSEPAGEPAPQPGAAPQEDPTPSAEPTEENPEPTPSPENEGKPSAEGDPQPPADDSADEPPANPAAPSLERISLKSLHPDDRKLIADAKEMVRSGKAAGLTDALAQLTQPEQPSTQEPGPSAGTSPETSPDAEPQDDGAQAAPQQQSQNPVDSDPEVTRLTAHIAELRTQRQTAVENFERDTEMTLTTQIEDAVAQLGFARADATNQLRQAQTQDQAFQAAVEEVNVAHPETEDNTSFFYFRLSQEVQTYENQRGSIRNSPAQLMVLADKVAKDIAAQTPAQPEPQPAPQVSAKQPAVAPPAKAARPLGEAAPGVASTGRATPDQLQRFMNEATPEEMHSVLFQGG